MASSATSGMLIMSLLCGNLTSFLPIWVVLTLFPLVGLLILKDVGAIFWSLERRLASLDLLALARSGICLQPSFVYGIYCKWFWDDKVEVSPVVWFGFAFRFSFKDIGSMAFGNSSTKGLKFWFRTCLSWGSRMAGVLWVSYVLHVVLMACSL